METERNNNIEKGKTTELKFKEWLDKHKIPYLYIQQDIETFSPFFRELFTGKRPDFILLVPNFGVIFVDVKYKKFNQNHKGYPIDSEETKIFSSLQRKFNINVWFALSNDDVDYKTWLWISPIRVLECGVEPSVSPKSKMDFFSIPTTEFTQISFNDSLDRLFTDLFKNA